MFKRHAISHSLVSEALFGLTPFRGPLGRAARTSCDGRLTAASMDRVAESASQYGYGYDALGRRTSVTNSGNASDEPAFNIYGYNSRNELTSSKRYLGTSILDTARSVDDE